jgi:hypothetical protein
MKRTRIRKQYAVTGDLSGNGTAAFQERPYNEQWKRRRDIEEQNAPTQDRHCTNKGLRNTLLLAQRDRGIYFHGPHSGRVTGQ